MLTAAAAAAAAATPLFVRNIRASSATCAAFRSYLTGVRGNLQSFHEVKLSTGPHRKVNNYYAVSRCLFYRDVISTAPHSI